MKFTPSTDWNILTRAASKYVQTRVYARVVTDLGIALDSGDWYDISRFVDPIDAIEERIEYQVGQYTIGALRLRASGLGAVDYFKNYIFPAASNLITNGTFEANTTGWTAAGSGASITRNTSGPISGNADGAIATSNATTGVYFQAIALTSGVKYRVSFMFKKGVSTANIKWKIGKTASISAAEFEGTSLINFPLTEDVATRKSYIFTAKATADGYLTFFQSGAGYTAFNIDDVTVEPVQYTEVKIETKLGYGPSNMASDIAYMFSGFVGKKKKDIVYANKEGSVAFTAYTVDDIAADVSGQNITTQYIDPDAAGVGGAGLFLPRIHGVYVTDANVSGYPLQLGAHTLTFSAGDLTLDDGDPVTLAAGTNTLINGDGTQKLEVYAYTGMLQSTDASETIVVDVYGETLPKNLYFGLSVKNYIKKAYELIGITDVDWDELKIQTYDRSKRISFYDVPTVDASVTAGYYFGICSDGTDIWVSVGNVLYQRDAITGNYTARATLTAGYVIKRLIYNARNNHIWILYDTGSPLPGVFNEVRVYDIGGAVLSNASTIGVSAGATGYVNSVRVVDYNYTGSSYKYALVACTAGSSLGVYFFIEITKSGTTLTQNGLRAYSGVEVALDVGVWQDSNEVYFGAKDSLSGYVIKFHITGAGAWVDDGVLNIINPVFNDVNLKDAYAGAYNNTDNLLYFASGSVIYSWTPGGSVAAASVFTGVNSATFTSDENDYVYGSILKTSDEPFYRLYSFIGSVATKITDKEEVKVLGSGLSCLNGNVLYGITQEGFVWQYSIEINLYLNRKMPQYADKKVREIYSGALQSFNLMGKISAAKKGMVYRRGGIDGTPTTSGNTLTIDVSDAGDIVEEVDYSPAADYVVVDNGEVSITYDGMEFNTAVPIEGTPFTLSSELIPTNIIRDVAKYIYEFFKDAKTLYRFPLNQVALFQHEAFDELSIAFTTTKIKKTGTGPMYAITSRPNAGSMTIEALL